ncbi:DUF7535 family protein [Halocalculus aciditolerans]|uniref:Uncharacterized protein n=1 Tax=Halocalculus aciditolerans TaxID=1383812 RepID=A0A830EZI4_9EURY|nr:hypothetical protein [Halocalculus aciditolerans]GGL45896.1 hypothetical protein GCM10009039_00280 [Halocalculus aciditolerans]
MSEEGLGDFILQALFRPRDRGAREMTVIGLLIGLLLLVIVVPLIPVLVVLWILDLVVGDTESEEEYAPAH